MEEAVTAHLLASAGVTALVGQRVTWLERPQASALPAIVLQRIGGQPDYAMDGPTGLAQSRVQVDCWGGAYATAKAVARAVVEGLSGASFAGSGMTVHGTFFDNERDFIESDAADVRLYRTSLDFILWTNG